MGERKNSIGESMKTPNFYKNPEIDVFDNMTAFSPPNEDSYFPLALGTARKSSKYITGSRFDTITEDGNLDRSRPEIVKSKQKKGHKDLAQHLDHLDSCKKFIVNQEIIVKGQTKGQGVDDGFKDAICSSKLLKMAERMMTNKQFVNASVDDDEAFQISSLDDQGELDYRRGSFSLPASPKQERKNYVNPYFTVTKPENTKRGDISILTSLFGITARKDLTTSQMSITSQKEESSSASEGNNKNSITGISDMAKDHDAKPSASTFFKAKPVPSELREMNFWSPTSS